MRFPFQCATRVRKHSGTGINHAISCDLKSETGHFISETSELVSIYVCIFQLCLHFSIMSAFFELSPHFFNYVRIFLIMSAFLKFMSIFFKLCLHFLNLFLHFLIWHFWATIFFDWQSSYRFTTYRKIQYKALIQFLTCVDFRQSLETRNACNAI